MMTRKVSLPKCACGCGNRAAHRHHIVYEQHLPKALHRDQRNFVPVWWECHFSHHNSNPKFDLAIFPDEAFEFAAEALGPGAAYEYLGRYYSDIGSDPRRAALIA